MYGGGYPQQFGQPQMHPEYGHPGMMPGYGHPGMMQPGYGSPE